MRINPFPFEPRGVKGSRKEEGEAADRAGDAAKSRKGKTLTIY